MHTALAIIAIIHAATCITLGLLTAITDHAHTRALLYIAYSSIHTATAYALLHP